MVSKSTPPGNKNTKNRRDTNPQKAEKAKKEEHRTGKRQHDMTNKNGQRTRGNPGEPGHIEQPKVGFYVTGENCEVVCHPCEERRGEWGNKSMCTGPKAK